MLNIFSCVCKPSVFLLVTHFIDEEIQKSWEGLNWLVGGRKWAPSSQLSNNTPAPLEWEAVWSPLSGATAGRRGGGPLRCSRIHASDLQCIQPQHKRGRHGCLGYLQEILWESSLKAYEGYENALHSASLGIIHPSPVDFSLVLSWLGLGVLSSGLWGVFLCHSGMWGMSDRPVWAELDLLGLQEFTSKKSDLLESSVLIVCWS